mmetsp:Transcript_30184/g.59088  ORF Transcript_30184/g.59088 Transcript_30184/m.59088 type:complete len:774 (-) Transcript_30184:87-2408(-)|eukprot:CAMPEP_0175138356 /NCGR_PEP_ID=MMETSP0087-20121206/10303_1 /TAXON_ID=136419 /ORGANISM="Unknown Unknown, Strain D1" /LENGTH=773 /DNA_ID=CAMNT_0016421249 /DNA_START=59 /DNA_END=2380 /DNA_ORIENTATION=+
MAGAYAVFALAAASLMFPISAVTPFKPSNAPNMNGEYSISPTAGAGDPKLFPSQFRDYPHGVEYFDMYSENITTLYSQVWWKPLKPSPLPADIVQRYAGKGMAIVGFEVDQVVRTPEGDVRVPISASYNHHYVSVMVGAKSRFVATNFDGPDDPRIPNMYGGRMPAHGVPWEQTNYVVEKIEDGSLPSSHLFDGANGGEYRKSFHGVAPGHALIVESPTELQITPMQIDTWNRDKMDITKMPCPFVPGPLPRASQSLPGDVYSGLLECPITTRITKKVDGGYIAQGAGHCATPIQTASECFQAALATVGGNISHSSGTDPSQPPGCSMSTLSAGATSRHIAFFNSLQSSTTACAAKASIVAGSAASLTSVDIQLDEAQGEATISLSGPSDVWFGVGFNATKMADTPWTIVVDGAGHVSEHLLADHAPGSLLSPSVKVVSSTVKGALRTVVLTRPLKGKNSSYFTFDAAAADATLHFINAVGSGPSFSYHKSRAPSSVTLLPVGKGAGVCICPEAAKPFGKGTGTIIYNPTNQPADTGTGSDGFGKTCLPEPATDMLWQENPTCDIRSYVGGMDVCKHGWSLLDADQDIPWVDTPLVIQQKYRFWVQPYNASYHTSLVRRNNWGLGSPIEFDVPKCAPGVKGCSQNPDGLWVHTVQGAFTTDGTLGAVHFHCHAPTCINMTLYKCPSGTPLSACNATTGELMCNQVPIYGNGTGTYQEPGYIKIQPCLWGRPEEGLEPPPKLEDLVLYLIKTSNATVGHTGEMAAAQVYTFPSS